MKVFLKTEDEIELMRQANQLVGKTLGELARHIKPGVTTLQLDKIADTFIRDHGAIPTSRGSLIHMEGRFQPVSARQSMMWWYMECPIPTPS